ncbi:MAG: biotin synthase BioB [Planctomycetota bacterium]
MNRNDAIVNGLLKRTQITREDAEYLIKADLWDLLHGANRLRRHFKGDKIGLCSIINAKSGNCAEDCRFCAQSVHHSAEAKTYPLVSNDEIHKGFRHARQINANGYSIVTSGNELTDTEVDTLCEVIQDIPQDETYLCGSLGRLTPQRAKQLKSAGLSKAHHNIETSRRFFEQVCTTHTYDERLETIRILKETGFKVCSGGIFGMGETWPDRLDMAFTLRELDVDSVPLNFLMSIKGTALENTAPLAPLEILKIIALFRYILPGKNIRVCAGRERNLRDLQSWIFFAGADGMMIGGYLTQPGRNVEDDLQMIRDLGLIAERHG